MQQEAGGILRQLQTAPFGTPGQGNQHRFIIQWFEHIGHSPAQPGSKVREHKPGLSRAFPGSYQQGGRLVPHSVKEIEQAVFPVRTTGDDTHIIQAHKIHLLQTVEQGG